MGPLFNGPEVDFCPMVSPDGRWFSFSRRYGKSWDTTTDAEIYWVDASVLDALRPDQVSGATRVSITRGPLSIPRDDRKRR